MSSTTKITWTEASRTSREGHFTNGDQRYVIEMTLESTRYSRRTARLWWWAIRTEGGAEMKHGAFAGAPVRNAKEIVARFCARLNRGPAMEVGL